MHFVPDAQCVVVSVDAIAVPMNFSMMIVLWIIQRRSRGDSTLGDCFLSISGWGVCLFYEPSAFIQNLFWRYGFNMRPGFLKWALNFLAGMRKRVWLCLLCAGIDLLGVTCLTPPGFRLTVPSCLSKAARPAKVKEPALHLILWAPLHSEC